jgi:sugar phosphate isomerase/epimerase
MSQATVKHLSLREAAEVCVRHGIGAIGIWRETLGDVRTDARMLRDLGLRVSSLTRSGQFVTTTAQEHAAMIDDSRRAIEEAAILGAECLTVLGSGCVQLASGEATAQMADGLAEIYHDAEQAGVVLGVEAGHPMRADQTVLTTLESVADLLDQLPPSAALGALVDIYNTWWDPLLAQKIERLRGRIVGVQIADWLAPMPPFQPCRGFLGDGTIAFRPILDAIDATGYTGSIEVEIFNQEIWALPADDIARRVVEGFALAG